MCWLILLTIVMSSPVWAIDCPHWIGINANGVLEYCDAEGNTRYVAPAGDSMGRVTMATPAPIPSATPVPTSTPLSAVYNPASLAANAARCDSVTVTGVVAGRPLIPMPQTTPAPGCVMSVPPQATGANTVQICWRNAFAATTACDTAASTWLFTQP